MDWNWTSFWSGVGCGSLGLFIPFIMWGLGYEHGKSEAEKEQAAKLKTANQNDIDTRITNLFDGRTDA